MTPFHFNDTLDVGLYKQTQKSHCAHSRSLFSKAYRINASKLVHSTPWVVNKLNCIQ